MAQWKYPVGQERFKTIAPVVTEAFSIDFGSAASTCTTAIKTYDAGTLMLGFAGIIREAAESATTGTMQFGLTGTVLLTSALSSGAMTVGDYIAPAVSNEDNLPLLLKSDDTFDVIGATTIMTAGKVDMYVTYIPLPKDALDTNVFHVYVTT